MACPEPSGPVRKIDLPMADKSGSTASMVAPLPPAMMASEPSTARFTPPDTGASMKRMPAAMSSSPSARVATGSDELMSMTMASGER